MDVKQFKHGLSGYKYHKCRCSICSRSVSEQAKRRYENKEVREIRIGKAKEYYYSNRERILAEKKEMYSKPEHKAIKAEYSHNRYIKNRTKILEQSKAYHDKPEVIKRQKHNDLIKRFGISLEHYNNLSENQCGVCAICGGVNINKNALAVDHNHLTGKVRGLLCSKCNIGIGYLKESKTVLTNAISYLKKWEQ